MKKLAMLFSALAMIAVLAFLGFNSNMLRAADATQCTDECDAVLQAECVVCVWKSCHGYHEGGQQCCTCELPGYGLSCDP